MGRAQLFLKKLEKRWNIVKARLTAVSNYASDAPNDRRLELKARLIRIVTPLFLTHVNIEHAAIRC